LTDIDNQTAPATIDMAIDAATNAATPMGLPMGLPMFYIDIYLLIKRKFSMATPLGSQLNILLRFTIDLVTDWDRAANECLDRANTTLTLQG
jgi:hypothetical protein